MSTREMRLGRRLHHAGFLQPRLPAFWLFVLIVGLTGIVALAEQSLYRSMSPSGWALSWFLLALYGLPVVLVVYVLDLYEREPVPLLVAVFVWGAIAATTLSAIGNAGWGLTVARLGGPEFAARWTAALTAPFVEEILKGCGVVLIYLIARDEVDDVMDGFVYGAICGLGFAIVEDVFYFSRSSAVSRRGWCRASGCGSWPAGSTGTCCTRGWWAWRSGWSSRAVRRSLCDTGSGWPRVSALSRRSPTSCGTRRS